MAAPFVAIAAISAVSALAQYYQSEKARGANEKELARMREEWDRLVPPDYDGTIMTPPERLRELPMPPSFDLSRLSPEQFKVVGKYEPKLVPLIKEVAPEVVKRSEEGRQGRSAQMDALRLLKDQAASRSNPELRAQIDEAARRSQAEAQSRQGSILQDAQRRGALNSGVALAAQLQGGEAAQLNQAQAGRQAAIEAYRQRMQAVRDSASLGGQIDSADLDLSSRNAGIINAYNERMSRNAQNLALTNTGAVNEAQLRNLNVQQDTANRNTDQNNRAAISDRDRKDDLLRYLHGLKMQDVDYQNQGAFQEAEWRRRERDYGNDLKSRAFGDRATIIAGKTGVGQAAMGMNRQNAADRNQMYQGLGNAAVGGIAAYQDSRERADDRAERERDRRAYGGYSYGGYYDDDQPLWSKNPNGPQFA